MVNKKGDRELAYVVKIDGIEPIPGKDRVECAVVGGWKCMVPKGQFHVGSLGIYFEIDSRVDCDKPEFSFTSKYNGKIKTQKFKNRDGSVFYSQGLLMHPNDLGWEVQVDNSILNRSERVNRTYNVGTGLTKELGVTYSTEEDNYRKSSNKDYVIKRLSNKYPKFFNNRFIKLVCKTDFGKKLICFIFPNSESREYPFWVINTDEIRVQNIVPLLESYSKERWIATEKRDGTSSTYTIRKLRRNKFDYAICSRNVRCDDSVEGPFYSSNVYSEMDKKYNLHDVLLSLIKSDDKLSFVTIQGEIFGKGIQKRRYGLNEHVLEVFNVIFGYNDGTTKRLNPIEMRELMSTYDVPTVPIVMTDVVLPVSCDEILKMADGEASLYGGMREGLVFRNYDATKSFKSVSNEFLTKYYS